MGEVVRRHSVGVWEEGMAEYGKDPEELSGIHLEIVQRVAAEVAPIKKKRVRQQISSPWYTGELNLEKRKVRKIERIQSLRELTQRRDMCLVIANRPWR